MITCDNEGIILSEPATAQDILDLSKAIVTASETRLHNGYVISQKIIDNMIRALDETTEAYRKRIKQGVEHVNESNL